VKASEFVDRYLVGIADESGELRRHLEIVYSAGQLDGHLETSDAAIRLFNKEIDKPKEAA